MTKRDFYNAIINSNVSDELKEFSQAEIENLDRRNRWRSSIPSKTAIANAPIKTAILDYVKSHANAIASDIATACEISTQKASVLCTQMVNENLLTKADIKVPKKGAVKAYTAVVEE
jgi:hypothetical protein